MSEITLGMLGIEDAEELRRVAERDSSAIPAGMVIGARVDGRLVAARAVADGHSVADPFVHTAELQQLLEKRAAQLGGKGRGGPGKRFSRRARAQALSSSSRVAA